MLDRGIMRENQNVYLNDNLIGYTTSYSLAISEKSFSDGFD